MSLIFFSSLDSRLLKSMLLSLTWTTVNQAQFQNTTNPRNRTMRKKQKLKKEMLKMKIRMMNTMRSQLLTQIRLLVC